MFIKTDYLIRFFIKLIIFRDKLFMYEICMHVYVGRYKLICTHRENIYIQERE